MLLREVCKEKPQVRGWRVRCRHCGIFFLTYPGNRGRQDLGCPFGCQEAWARKQSRKRSQDYYHTEEGRKKKRQLNRKRSLFRVPSQPQQSVPPAPSPIDLPGPVTSTMVQHVRLVLSVIEDRWLAREEVLELIAQILRQRGLGRRGKIAYALERLNKEPP